MVDFKSRLLQKTIKRPIDPVAIYNCLDRVTSKGELRPAQKTILEKWFNNYYDKKDSIIKLSTGKGKTLIGLLILQSKINKKEGPCLYLCPNKYLVEQTCAEAANFGIEVCTAENELPIDFENGKKILVTTVKKLFNAKSRFGINRSSISVNTIVLDDSHACLDEIQSAFTIKIYRKTHQLVYDNLFNLFSEDLKKQGSGTFEELKQGNSTSYLPTPYWSWQDNLENVIKILTKYTSEDFLCFQWDVLKDNLNKCNCIFGNDYIEISPYILPIEKFGSFNNAKNRIYMSATVNNDTFFIKHLNMDLDTIKNPIKLNEETLSGEKMILLPSLIDPTLDNDSIMDIFAKESKARECGICILTPSFKKALPWGKNGALISKGDDIGEIIKALKEGNYTKSVVFANRYDGLDLPDSACRILIFDGIPYSECLIERYYEDCLSETNLTITKIAQKIEQGLGRNVRGEKDYGAILILGKDLIRFLRADKYKKYFSAQTQKQIEIGLNVAEFAKEELEIKDAKIVLTNLLKQLLKRDEGWKAYYADEMKDVLPSNDHKILTELLVQREAEFANYNNQHEDAVNILQNFINNNRTILSQEEWGWYLQQIARYKYFYTKSQSVKAQQAAYEKNPYLLKPNSTTDLKLLKFNKTNQANSLKLYLENFESKNDFELEVQDILDSLKFGIDSEKFEKGLKNLGLFLGFNSERPDKQYKEGPDNLWAVDNNEYFVFECKNEVKENRNCISQSETGQMNNTYNWFSRKYPEAKVNYIMVIPTNNVDSRGGFNCKVSIIKEQGLNKLRKNLENFVKDLLNSGYNDLSEIDMANLIEIHQLTPKAFIPTYCVETQFISIHKSS